MARDEQNPLILTVSEPGAGRLDQFLTQTLTHLSRSTLQNWIKAGLVEVNGASVKNGYALSAGDQITIKKPVLTAAELSAAASAVDADPGPDLNILYEDDAILVINKPSGLTVHPGAGTGHQPTVVSALKRHLGSKVKSLPGEEDRPGIVHRLDKDTSGVMVIAKTLEAHRHLSNQFKDKSNLREYVGLLDGVMKDDEMMIESYLYRDPRHRTRFASMSTDEYQIMLDEGRDMQGYRYAKTYFRKRKVYANRLTLATMRLSTGRTHQIRVHARHINCAVLGDATYAKSLQMPSGLPAELRTVLAGIDSQLLHARRLGLEHPVDGRKLAFEAPLPDVFRAVLELLEKHTVST